MADQYVYSGAGGGATGADWTNARLTLAAALGAMSAGDTAWVAHDHAETQASNMTLTSPGTAASPCRIICVNRAGTVPPVSADLRATATVSTTSSFTLAFAGFSYCYGIAFQAGSGSSSGNLSFNSTSPYWWLLDSCALKLLTTSTVSRINLGVNNANQDDSALELVNTPLTFGSTSQGIVAHCRISWRNTASAIGGTVPTTLFLANVSGVIADVAIVGVDLSAAGSGKNLIDCSPGCANLYSLIDCKLGASVSVTTGSVAGQGGTAVRMVNCDSADTNYRYYKQTYQGTITQESTIVRAGGASDGATPISRKMVSTANSKLYSPLESDWIVVWNETTGSSLTATIEVVTDNVTLKDNEAWLEVEYLGTSGVPLGSFVSDRAPDILDAGTNQDTSTETWTTTGLGTPVKQKFSKAFTPQEKGPVRVRVCLAKASTTMYFCPKVTVA